MNAITRRLREPSTWAGLGLLLTQAAQAMTGDPTAIVAIVTGAVAVLRSERAPEAPSRR